MYYVNVGYVVHMLHFLCLPTARATWDTRRMHEPSNRSDQPEYLNLQRHIHKETNFAYYCWQPILWRPALHPYCTVDFPILPSRWKINQRKIKWPLWAEKVHENHHTSLLVSGQGLLKKSLFTARQDLIKYTSYKLLPFKFSKIRMSIWCAPILESNI